MCPQKPAPRAPLEALEDVPCRVAAMCITDADGFTKVPPRRSGQRLGDFIASIPAPRCNGNRFMPLSIEDWQHVAAKIAEEPEMRSSDVFAPPSLGSPTAFPILSCSTSLSPAPSSSPTASASGQGEVIAEGRAHSASRVLRISDKVLEESCSRHAEFN